MPVFIDIHCHIVPNIDDGATNLQQSVRMAHTAVEDGTKGLITTPHQLGSTGRVTAKAIKNGIALLRDQVNHKISNFLFYQVLKYVFTLNC